MLMFVSPCFMNATMLHIYVCSPLGFYLVYAGSTKSLYFSGLRKKSLL
uniref:Uncharacterized protein n=1 Tax=Arundo donax TaxID=35708 RepID=A0A0A8ZR08_ARUDO